MTKRAYPDDGVPVLSAWEIEGTKGIEVSCEDYSVYKVLPEAVRYEGIRYIKTGWNSDRCIACYQTGIKHAEKDVLGIAVKEFLDEYPPSYRDSEPTHYYRVSHKDLNRLVLALAAKN